MLQKNYDLLCKIKEEGIYEVDFTTGNIYNKNFYGNRYLLSPCVTKVGCCMVNLNSKHISSGRKDSRKMKPFLVSNVVAVFGNLQPPPIAPYVIHHLDGDRMNNAISNLQVSSSTNHAIIHAAQRNCKKVQKEFIQEKTQIGISDLVKRIFNNMEVE